MGGLYEAHGRDDGASSRLSVDDDILHYCGGHHVRANMVCIHWNGYSHCRHVCNADGGAYRRTGDALMDDRDLKAALEYILDQAKNPLSNPLDVGFRHSPLSIVEKIERYKETLQCISADIEAILRKFD